MSALLGVSTGSSGSDGGLLGSLTPMAAQAYGYKGKPDTGTGIKQLLDWARKQNLLTPVTLNAIVPELPGLFGGYPQNEGIEIGPDALFIGVFAVLFLANMYILLRNTLRGHQFFLQLGIAFVCVMKIVGYSCRLAWAKDIARLATGISSVVFIQVAQLALEALNLILAHRILTWRHPETGRHWIVVWFINVLYLLVLAIIAMAIVGQALPYVYFLDLHHHHICRNVMKAAAILNLLYALLPLGFLIIAYIFKPGLILKLPQVVNHETNELERVMPAVYQPTWIKSAHLFYFPEKKAQLQVYKGEPVANAVRIIPSREPPKAKHVRVNPDDVMHPQSPRYSWTVLTTIVASVVLVMNTCFRVAACFRRVEYATVTRGGHWKVNFWPHEPYVMFIFYGATEACVMVFYLLMRIDLRFYIPDMVRGAPKGGIPPLDDPIPPEDRPVTWAGTEFEKEHDSQDNGSYSQH